MEMTENSVFYACRTLGWRSKGKLCLLYWKNFWLTRVDRQIAC